MRLFRSIEARNYLEQSRQQSTNARSRVAKATGPTARDCLFTRQTGTGISRSLIFMVAVPNNVRRPSSSSSQWAFGRA